MSSCAFLDESDVSEMRSQLSLAHHNPQMLRNVLKRVMEVHMLGVDVRVLLADIAKLVSCHDLLVKKVACILMQQYSNKCPELALFCVNILQRESCDPNPAVRALSIRTLCYFPGSADIVETVVLSGLRDSSPYVRRTSVLCCIKLFQINPDFVSATDIVDRLYALLSDSDSTVVCNVLVALEHVLGSEGGMVVNRKIAHHLISRLSSFTDWGVTVVLKMLIQYKPKTEDETIEIMNTCDFLFSNQNLSVVVGTINYFLHLTMMFPELRKFVAERAKKSILPPLSTNNYELLYFVLSFLLENIEQFSVVFDQKHVRKFYCRCNEPTYIQKTKIKILCELITDENKEELIEEICSYSTSNKNEDVTATAISSLGVISSKYTGTTSLIFSRFADLLKLNADHLVISILYVVQKLKSEIPYSHIQGIIDAIVANPDILSNGKSKAPFLSLVNSCKGNVTLSSYLLDDFIDGIDIDKEVEVSMSLLTATALQFIQQPAECQEMLGELIQKCVSSKHRQLPEKAYFLYNLLRIDIALAKSVLTSNVDYAESRPTAEAMTGTEES